LKHLEGFPKHTGCYNRTWLTLALLILN